MTVIKRDRQATTQDLIQAINKLCLLLQGQNDDEAIEDLKAAAIKLGQKDLDKQTQREAVSCIIDAFEGDHELIAYTHQRDSKQWTEVEELSQASSRVITLARRMQRSL